MYAGTIPTSAEVAALILIGFSVGVAGSFFGVGGAFLVTPALNMLGFPMILAIGTDMAHMTGKSIIATLRHRKLGHIDLKAGALLLLGTLPGVKLGSMAVMALERIAATEWVLRYVYIAILTTVGLLMLRESMSSRGELGHNAGAYFQRRFRIPPFVSLPVSKIESISIWVIIFLGFATGFMASFLGVGGGFIRMPALLYLIGMPVHIAVGTDLLEVIFSGAYGTFLYARGGHVDIIAALVMLSGASIGSQLGAQATKYVEASLIKKYLAVMVLGSAVAVAAKQAGQAVISAILLWTLASSLAGFILYKLALGIRAEKSVLKKDPVTSVSHE